MCITHSRPFLRRNHVGILFASIFLALARLLTSGKNIISRTGIFGVVNVQNSTDVITVTSNDDGGYITVQLIAVNQTGQTHQTGVAINETVLVSCEIVTPYAEGDAVVEFLDEVIPKGEIEGSVPFNLTEQGREVQVRCRGQSQTEPGDITELFNYTTSQGAPGYIAVKKSPIVSFCDAVVEVPYAEGIISSTVPVQLSEPVDQYAVIVSCKINKVVDNETFLYFTFEDKVATPGMDSIVMEYDIIRHGSPVMVACTASSVEGQQFLTNTSSGSSALFILSTGSVQLVPLVSHVYAPTFTAFLVLSDAIQPNEGEITFVCNLVPINSTESAMETISDPSCVFPEDPEMSTVVPADTTVCHSDSNTTCPTTEASPVSAAPNISQVSPWILRTTEFVFEEGEIYKEVVAELKSPYGSHEGALLLTCCGAYDVNTSPKYTNASAALAILSDVKPILTINASTVPDASVGLQETELLNPAYVEVSPCPCDVYKNKCDTDCCCDMDCYLEDKMMFSCLAGIPGGDFTPSPDYLCEASSLYHPDWFPFLCVEVTNSPHLGLYFTTIAGVRDISSFNSLKAESISPATTSFEDTSSRELDFDETPGSDGYRNGYPVELIYESNLRGYLTTPMGSRRGECVDSSVVRFQEDSWSGCSLRVEVSGCADHTPLSARAHLQPTQSSYPPCPAVPQVIREYGQASPTSTSVSYYCVGDDVDPYLKSSAGHELNATKTELFGDGDEDSGEDTIPRCAWDDGYTVPLVPTYDPEAGTCDNIVLEVVYQLFWRGGAIVSVEASVILGSVSVRGNLSQVKSIDEYDFITAPPFPIVTPTPEFETTPETTDGNITVDMVTEYDFATELLADFGVAAETNATPPTTPSTMMPNSPPTTRLTTPLTTILTTPPTTQAMLTTLPPSTPATSPMTQFLTVTEFQFFNSTMSPPVDSTPVPLMSAVLPPSIESTPDPTESGVQTLTQSFRVSFTHLPEEELGSDQVISDPDSESTAQYQSSGNPGYDIGLMVLSGRAVYEAVGASTPAPLNCTMNTTDPLCEDTGEITTTFSIVDVSDGHRLQLINPGTSGLCSEASTREITFGEDALSGCLLRLSLSDLSNCTELRQYMKGELEKYMPADLISKTGDPDVLEESDWAPIFSSSVIVEDPANTPLPTQESATTPSAGTTANLTQTYYSTPLPIVEHLTGVCYNIPTGINLEVLIADVGEYNGYTLQEILAANIKYTYSVLQMSCAGADGVRCQSGNTTGFEEEYVHSFMVTSTVTFTKVPATTPEPVILFHQDYNPTLCRQDVCWGEMLYPITESFQGESYQYSLAVTMVTILITTGYLIVTKPWFGFT